MLTAAMILAAVLVQDQSPADAIIEMEESDSTWTRHCERAFALHLGVSEERLKTAVPGFNWPKLPEALQPLMSGNANALEQLIPMLYDSRPTKSSGEDILGNKDDQTRLTVSDLAMTLTVCLIPLRGLPEVDDEKKLPGLLVPYIRAWAVKSAAMSPSEKLPVWFEGASDMQRRVALAFFLFTDHAPAWTVIEKSLLQRAEAKEEHDFVVLEAAALVRHRRNKASDFIRQLAVLKPGLLTGLYAPLFAAKDGRSMLMEPFTPAQRVQQYLHETLSGKDLESWVIRGIDQPWAYHGVGIEPVSMHVPHVDRCLVAVVEGASSTNDLSKRLGLLNLAEGLAETRNDIIRHARKDEITSTPGPRDVSQASLVAALKALLTDKREAYDLGRLVSPAFLASQCVWSRWGTNTRNLDTVFHGVEPDWRGRAESFPRDHAQLAIEAAIELLDTAEPMRPEPYPKERAQQLSTSFRSGSSEDWRQRMQALRWDERLLLCEQATQDEAFAQSLWPHMLRWMDLRKAEKLPESFQQIWREVCQTHSLDVKSFTALQTWIMQEASAGRLWAIVAESSPASPGLTLRLCPQTAEKPATETQLRISLDGTRVFSLREEYQLNNGKWKRIKLPYTDNDPELTEVLSKLTENMPLNYEKKAAVRILRLVLVCEKSSK